MDALHCFHRRSSLLRALDLDKIASGMKSAKMADLRNIYSADAAAEAGFVAYDSIGRVGLIRA